MRTLLRFVGGIVVLLVVLAGVAFVLPREVTVTRSAEIAAPPSKVFAELDSLQDFATWSPWQADDLENTFSGPESGVGNKMEWTSKDLGTGTQEITAIEQDARVETALDFGDMRTAKAAFILEPAGEGTGLGLSLAYEIITTGHGGALAVTSTEGEGTTFTVRLPAAG